MSKSLYHNHLAFLLRNIFQDVMHKDTLVKSFIDEVRIYHHSLHYYSRQ